MAARPHRHRLRPHQPYRSGAVALPHPSWRRAVEGPPATTAPRAISAEEFWAALGVEP
ncbi:hypothetical protein ACFOON_04480 [Novosphingobium piscinae]|uniref:Uncharacterized protein n=1 Tax=Novosphingobium piscinae TaxID=1507448 RepID=A0A7X1KRK8_9SPHN|nr:hypothetical protein [Novosphingobium piscinae]MBC2670934.1 hypothetical protein [Novosphingobium piscinae]